MAKSSTSSDANPIINGLFIISESFKRAGITEDDLMDTLHSVDFIHYFENVEDFRNPKTITYRLSDLLMMSFLTILSNGVNSFWGIADHVRICHEKYEQYGLLKDGRYPSHDTFRRVFSLINPQSLYEHTLQVFYDFLRSLEETISGRKSYRQVMIDGKEVKGSGRSSSSKTPMRNTNVLNVFDSSLKTCIKSIPVSDKTNEIPTAQDFLREFNLRNTVVTADALHCQRETADIISKNKGIYVLPVKDNHSLLKEEIAAKFDKDRSKAAIIKRAKRTFEILTLPKGYATDGFTGLKTFIKMISGAHSSKNRITMFFISNSGNNDLICQAIENRWEIENGLHKEKDMFLNEDRFRSSEKNTINCLAVLNNFAMQIIKIHQALTGMEIRESKIYVRNYPMETFRKIASVMDSDVVKEKIATEMKKVKKLNLK